MSTQPALDDFMQYVDGESKLVPHNMGKYKDDVEVIVSLWHYMNTPKWIELTKQEAALFASYKTQVDKSVYLAIVSILRQHYAQAISQLRYCAENICISMYSLFQPMQAFYIIKGNASIEERKRQQDKLKGAAYTWLEKNYPDFSKRIKELKDGVLNHFGTHANFALLGNNVKIGNQFTVNIFDEEVDQFSLGTLMIAGDLMIEYIKLIISLDGTNGIKLDSKSSAKLEEAIKEFERIKTKNKSLWFPT